MQEIIENLSSIPDSTDVMKRAVVIKISLGRPGNRKRVNIHTVDVKRANPDESYISSGDEPDSVDRRMVHVSKDLLDSPELKVITKYDTQIRSYVASRCLPSFFEGGKWLLPVKLISEVDQELTDIMQTERQRLIDIFIESYPRLKEEAKERLGHLYNPNDYPPESQLRDAFTFEINYLSFGVPGMLAEFSQEIFKREEEKLVKKVQEMGEECQQALRLGFADLVDHMVERLQPGEDGKKKSFKVSMVENLSNFLASFRDRDLTGDEGLSQLVNQAQEILEGKDPQEIAKELRTDDEMRERMQHRFENLKDRLETMIGNKASRAYDFDEEEEAATTEMENELPEPPEKDRETGMEW